MEKLRWGILGGGAVVTRWMNGACQFDDMEVAALGVRDHEKGLAKARACGITRVLTPDELLCADDITALYIAVPHSVHMEYAIKAMEQGKHVLIEKPVAVNAEQVKQIIACAERNHVFCMEAVWTRFFPAVTRLQTMAREGTIGDFRALFASFAYRVGEDADPLSRALNPALAGGGLLDVGVYPLHFAEALLGEAGDINGFAAINTGPCFYQVDEQAAFTALYSGGRIAGMACGVCTQMDDTAHIYATKGSVDVPVFWKPTTLQISVGSHVWEENFPVPQHRSGVIDEGFQYEIAHVNRCIRDGLTESPVMPLRKSLAVMTLCDRLREQWQLRYPFEK